LVFLLENIFMISASQLSSDQLDKMPGHWVLAKMGKRVLRPGGRKLTEKMLDSLNIQSDDRVVEFAPGLGFTAQLTLQHHPAFYTAIERDETAAEKVREYLIGDRQKCVVASADNTGLATSSATVVYGEAMLSMQNRKLFPKRQDYSKLEVDMGFTSCV
jgi:hypothetical protein